MARCTSWANGLSEPNEGDQLTAALIDRCVLTFDEDTEELKRLSSTLCGNVKVLGKGGTDGVGEDACKLATHTRAGKHPKIKLNLQIDMTLLHLRQGDLPTFNLIECHQSCP
jgi:hypothetical protein